MRSQAVKHLLSRWTTDGEGQASQKSSRSGEASGSFFLRPARCDHPATGFQVSIFDSKGADRGVVRLVDAPEARDVRERAVGLFPAPDEGLVIEHAHRDEGLRLGERVRDGSRRRLHELRLPVAHVYVRVEHERRVARELGEVGEVDRVAARAGRARGRREASARRGNDDSRAS